MNIILLISDTFRYDNLFDRAAMPVRTPHLDRFAERAVSVERFYTGSFPTIPQRTDLTTGRKPKTRPNSPLTARARGSRKSGEVRSPSTRQTRAEPCRYLSDHQSCDSS